MSTWVLLRGLTRESRHWGDFPRVFGQALAAGGIETPDLPGNGARYRQQSPARVESMVDQYRQDLASRGIAPPYRLLGLSLGGMVVVDWMRRHPAEVDAAVLVNSSLRGVSPFYRRLRPGAYPTVVRQACAARRPEEGERLILDLTSNRHRRDDRLLAAWLGYRRECPVSTGNALAQLVAAWRYRPPATAPAMPVLVLTSRGDRLVDWRCSTAIARRWDLALAIHPDGGHDLPLDDPDWVAERVRHWIAGVG